MSSHCLSLSDSAELVGGEDLFASWGGAMEGGAE